MVTKVKHANHAFFVWSPRDGQEKVAGLGDSENGEFRPCKNLMPTRISAKIRNLILYFWAIFLLKTFNLFTTMQLQYYSAIIEDILEKQHHISSFLRSY